MKAGAFARRNLGVSIVELLTALARHDEELAVEGQKAVDAKLAELEAMKAKAAQLDRELERAAHEREEYRKLYELTSLELERVRRHLFGKKSERISEGQLAMSFDAVSAPFS